MSTRMVFGAHISNRRSLRGAIMPYTVVESSSEPKKHELMFLLGVHRSTGDISDFGGGIKKTERDPIGALRELSEETKGIFNGYISVNDLVTYVATVRERGWTTRNEGYDGGMVTFFAPVGNEWLEKAPRLFNESEKSGKGHDEISELIWISETEFWNLVKGFSINTSDGVPRKLWGRLQKFYMDIFTKSFQNFRNCLFIRHNWRSPQLVTKDDFDFEISPTSRGWRSA